MATRSLSQGTSSPLADCELGTGALERIAQLARVDENVARRVLSAYWRSDEREARDLAIVAEVIRRLEVVTQRQLPCDGLEDIERRGELQRREGLAQRIVRLEDSIAAFASELRAVQARLSTSDEGPTDGAEERPKSVARGRGPMPSVGPRHGGSR